jgi:hypothetical protein
MSSAVISSATALARSPEKRKRSQTDLLRELRQMRKEMSEQEGLLNHSQAALFLDVTPARVTELVNLGTLRRFDFLGRTYVSVKQVMERRKRDVGTGRPRGGKLAALALTAKVLARNDPAQWVQGGPVSEKRSERSERKKK